MHTEALARLQLETDLRRALERQEFRLVYQPLVSLRTGRITGVEALVRWHHPIQGLIPPAQFVPLAEDTGLIVAIGDWVLEEACRQVQRWTPAHMDDAPLTVAVNLSVRQFLQPDVAERIARVLSATGLEAGRLVLEVTEGVVIDRPDAATEALVSVKALGTRVHMDDFGTGYSSLSYLHQLPFDGLKVDRAFVSSMDSDARSKQLVSTVLQLAAIAGLETVAEGISTVHQLGQLRELVCDTGQEFLFSAPLDAEAMQELITASPAW